MSDEREDEIFMRSERSELTGYLGGETLPVDMLQLTDSTIGACACYNLQLSRKHSDFLRRFSTDNALKAVPYFFCKSLKDDVSPNVQKMLQFLRKIIENNVSDETGTPNSCLKILFE